MESALKSCRVSALMSVAMLGWGNSDDDAGSPSPMLPATVFYDDQPALFLQAQIRTCFIYPEK
jgi:hypothetical protein